MNYKINIDYNIDELMSFADNICSRSAGSLAGKGLKLEYENQVLDGFNNFDDFKKNTAFIIRTTLENELKVSDIEALNYLMGFPLNFNLEFFVKILSDDMKMNKRTNIEKIKYLINLINQKTETETETEAIKTEKHSARLQLNFDKKKKLIEQNFESTKYIDVQEFLDWAESKGFIEKKYTNHGDIV